MNRFCSRPAGNEEPFGKKYIEDLQPFQCYGIFFFPLPLAEPQKAPMVMFNKQCLISGCLFFTPDLSESLKAISTRKNLFYRPSDTNKTCHIPTSRWLIVLVQHQKQHNSKYVCIFLYAKFLCSIQTFLGCHQKLPAHSTVQPYNIHLKYKQTRGYTNQKIWPSGGLQSHFIYLRIILTVPQMRISEKKHIHII